MADKPKSPAEHKSLPEDPDFQGKVISAITEIWRETGKEYSIKTTGKSMWPAIREGEEIIVRAVQPRDLRRGDVAAFRLPGSIVVHRVVAIPEGGQKIVEKGDNNMVLSIVEHSQILGRVLEIRSGGATFRLQSRPWRAIGLFVSYWGIGAVRIYGAVRYVKRMVLKERGGLLADFSRRVVHSVLLIPTRIAIGLGRLILKSLSQNSLPTTGVDASRDTSLSEPKCPRRPR